jgi:hypothetical protein
MTISKMNHAMMSFALMGGMLVGSKPSSTPKPPKSPSRPSGRK